MTETLLEIFPQMKEYPIPTNEQISDIVTRYQQGDAKAEDELKHSCMRFVASVAKRYLDHGLTKDELLKSGIEGLMIAGKRYDKTQEPRFIPYAVWWIKQGILYYISMKKSSSGILSDI